MKTATTVINAATNLVSNISSISSLWTENTPENIFNNKEILQIGNILSSLFNDPKVQIKNSKLEMPRLVVVGTQSSGKSSLLNRLLSMDILPVGKMMVTRTPLHIELQQSSPNNSSALIEFGHFQQSEWISEKKFNFTPPYPSSFQITQIQKEIEIQTNKKAGKNKNISSNPIYMKVVSPNVINLNLIDLPGLTMVACTDKGQPADIKHQIRELVKSYISSPRTLILSVMAARPDLEADMGLDLIKECDPDGSRTIGIITKVDLMNNENDISHYIQNNISKDLKLNYGYYAIKNRSHSQLKTISPIEAIKTEFAFFEQHPIYSKLSKDWKKRLGIVNVGLSMNEILIQNIKESIPDILKEIIEEESSVDKKLKFLGVSMSDDPSVRTTIIHHLLSVFSKEYISALEDRNAKYNSGKLLKDIFNEFKNLLDCESPFTKENYSNKQLNEFIDNSEGNHMSYLSSPIGILEHCLKDTDKKPLHRITVECEECIKKVFINMKMLVNTILESDDFSRYPRFVNRITNELSHTLFMNLQLETLDKVKEFIKIEENYIWTDSEIFKKAFTKILDKRSLLITPEDIRDLLTAYYKSYIEIVKHMVPKFIMFYLVNKSETNIQSTLFQSISSNNSYSELLREEPEVEKERVYYSNLKKTFQKAREILTNF